MDALVRNSGGSRLERLQARAYFNNYAYAGQSLPSLLPEVARSERVSIVPEIRKVKRSGIELRVERFHEEMDKLEELRLTRKTKREEERRRSQGFDLPPSTVPPHTLFALRSK